MSEQSEEQRPAPRRIGARQAPQCGQPRAPALPHQAVPRSLGGSDALYLVPANDDSSREGGVAVLLRDVAPSQEEIAVIDALIASLESVAANDSGGDWIGTANH